ncbi:HAD-superfamily hydrolase [Rhizopus microsporus var. microsporus]|uniref:HAD-superfamily hydrolase n=2 Tax=Rhizopus microsporus TaxID=58291 RepID=A0A2G4T526_RHIZD|nr:HAD-superfamily hydrolase [Rhizopus microsporus ATCC 52813]ORE04773.1 HAD-superfamily hydrolase [Rhizopus microsporus var. microsporus]PHZ16109.1 HAD-superfamily hydrolase [Rhizopus microsporus ATCC 52813]
MTAMLKRNFLAKAINTTARFISTANKGNYAFAFDIDGVLIKGKRRIPEATRALKQLNGDNSANRKIPFVLLTNGGGMTEEEKAKQISEIVGVKVDPKCVILSHSPMQNLAEKYRNKRVLVVGGTGRNCYNVATKYGFQDVVIPHDVMHWNNSVWPHTETVSDLSVLTSSHPIEFSQHPIHAVMVFHDSFEWGRDLQIMLDALCSKGGVLGTRKEDYSVQDVPLYWSNNDLIWSTDFPAPRLGQGAFKHALEGLYSTLTGHELKSTSFGKPHAATYKFAEQIFNTIAGEQGRNVYAVGDNPAADIKGANDYGWTSILVRTGVFTGKDNSPDYPAKMVCENVEEAVEKVIAKEEGKL